MIHTLGIDVGSSYVKTVLMDYSDSPTILEKSNDKIHKRNPRTVIETATRAILNRHDLTYRDLDYVSSTGEGELVKQKTGHFYGMTTHAKGGHFCFPRVKTVVDLGALFCRAIKVGDDARVLSYTMTGQCASGSGQFLENITRYLGLNLSEVGSLSLQSKDPERPSGVCAVLAETDVINMVARGVKIEDIIKGIHLTIAVRAVKLLSKLKAESPVVLTGGMAQDEGLVAAIREVADSRNMDLEIVSHRDSPLAGAIGAALWGGFRHLRLRQEEPSIKGQVTRIKYQGSSNQ
ncbi:MAG: BadF/BadG/BcrA/BcrD ATPase family protein [Candidatus Neomarinimicrobiota bacterium]